MHELHGAADHISTINDPRVAIDHLAGTFFGLDLAIDAKLVAPGDVPPPFHGLLVHNEHMTTSLEEYHGQPVRLEVIEDRLDRDMYWRKILLCVGDNHVVEVGVVRIHLRYTSDAVRQEILHRERPLGEILIRHDVLRRIEPKWFFKFESPSPVVAAFDRPIEGPVYGRVGLIHCDGQPAIELLEVVSGDRLSEPRP